MTLNLVARVYAEKVCALLHNSADMREGNYKCEKRIHNEFIILVAMSLAEVALKFSLQVCRVNAPVLSRVNNQHMPNVTM